MLKRYKNGFFNLIKEAGLSPTDFHVEDAIFEGLPAFIISLGDTPLKFIVVSDSQIRYEDDFDFAYTTFAPDFPQIPTDLTGDRFSIQDIYEQFKAWLTEHVIEYIDDLITPDLWAQIQKDKTLVNGDKISGDELTEFSKEEKIQLKLSINEFKQAIVTNFSPSETEMRIIDDRLNYLGKALDRLNRFDWRAIALSSLISITIALSLDTQKGHLLFELFKQLFSAALRYLQQ
jgi:hypothetical protein